jgi:hypothetical protein
MGWKTCQQNTCTLGDGFYLSEIWVFLGKLCGQPDKQDSGSRALDHTSGRVLLDHLDQAHAVAGAHLIQ